MSITDKRLITSDCKELLNTVDKTTKKKSSRKRDKRQKQPTNNISEWPLRIRSDFDFSQKINANGNSVKEMKVKTQLKY